MNKTRNDVTFKGRYLGLLFLVIIQTIVGLIHVVFGFALLLELYSLTSSMLLTVYSVYTLIYGSLSLAFAYLLWMNKRSGWVGTLAVSLFVIVVDLLAVSGLLNVFSIPAPVFAASGEIPYSLLVLLYLIQDHIRSKFGIKF
jgi:hypothetical protein